jgi:hypothetical protein
MLHSAMAPPSTTEMCERMVFWHSKLGKSNSEIVLLASCSECTVHDVLWIHCNYGVVYNHFAQPCGGCHSLDTSDLNYISSLLAANPCLYLDELQDQLATGWGIHVSIATISCTVQSLVLSHKHVSKATLERNEFLCAMWLADFIYLQLFAGAKLIYLSPYSLDYNLIEQTFHSIKVWLQ